MEPENVERLAKALAELEELRAENQRFRDLLGLGSRPDDGHRRAWAPTLLAQPTATPPVDARSPVEAKVALFRALFGARTDVFATRWENPATGKAGWSPAVRGGWSRGRTRRDYLPLTDDVFVSHLRGETTVGIYPLLRDDACTLLACDFDGGSWALDALAYLDACHGAEVPAALERSRSGDGAHVWVFFDGPVQASTARSLGAALLRVALTARCEIDLASYDRFFPSQDFVPRGSFGNLIALPLHGERLTQGATAFLDPTTMEPWPDQWRFLSSVGRLGADAAGALAQALRPVEAGPALAFGELARADGPPPPEVVRGRLEARLSIERSGLPPALVAGLKHLASIHNPAFYEKQRMRFSTWDTPRFIRCYDEDREWIHLPRGLVERVAALLVDLGSRLEVEDARTEHDPVGLRFAGALMAHQRDAVAAVVEHDQGVIVAPPGAGKTVMACAVIAHHDRPALVLVDREPLVEQWRDRLSEHLTLERGDVGVIGGGRSRATGRVDVAMIQSVARRERPAELFEGYGLIVVDECHHLPAVSFENCVRHAPSRCWLGLTATPYRRDGLEGLIAFQCGPTRFEIRPGELADGSSLRREVVVHETAAEVEEVASVSIQAVFTALVEDERRNEQICADVHGAVAAGRTCLVLTQRTGHIDAIATLLEAGGDQPLVLRGGLSKRAREAVISAIAERPDGEGIVLVATGSYLGEGFDWPELDTLFLAFPLAFKGRVVQYVGRLLRPHAEKSRVELHDYVDVHIPVVRQMHAKRLAAYSALGFDVPGGRVRTWRGTGDTARSDQTRFDVNPA